MPGAMLMAPVDEFRQMSTENAWPTGVMTAVLPVTTVPLATTSVVPFTVLQAVPPVTVGLLILVIFLLEVHVIFPPVAKDSPE